MAGDVGRSRTFVEVDVRSWASSAWRRAECAAEPSEAGEEIEIEITGVGGGHGRSWMGVEGGGMGRRRTGLYVLFERGMLVAHALEALKGGGWQGRREREGLRRTN